MTATTIVKRVCEQCGRSGTRGFKVTPAGNVDTPVGPVWIDEYTECSNRRACQKRWPKQTRDDD